MISKAIHLEISKNYSSVCICHQSSMIAWRYAKLYKYVYLTRLKLKNPKIFLHFLINF